MKTLSVILFATTIFVLLTGQVFSQSSSTDSQKKQTPSGITGQFVDKNNDGVCDNFKARHANGKGANFVDKDGDGICDNRQNVVPYKGNRDCCDKGKGYGYNHGRGNGYCCGKGYDNCRGQGHQHRHGCQNQKAKPATDQPSDNKKN